MQLELVETVVNFKIFRSFPPGTEAWESLPFLLQGTSRRAKFQAAPHPLTLPKWEYGYFQFLFLVSLLSEAG